MLRTTVGQLLVNQALPEDLRDHHRRLDKSGIRKLMRVVADQYPDQYREIAHRLSRVGADASYTSGYSISLRDLRPSETKKRIVADLRDHIRRIIKDNPDHSRREKLIVKALVDRVDEMRSGTMEESVREKNRFARPIMSGARGNAANLSSLRGADLILLDHKDRPIPIPILRNFSEGLDPVEYFAQAYGTRKGVVSVKLLTAKAGYLGKVLGNASSRLVVTDEDPIPDSGYPVETRDPDNEGAVLARDYGRFKAGIVLTPTIIKSLADKHDEILIHSPISSGGTGVSRIAAGIRERGSYPAIGDNIGLAAAQSISERISQGQLSAKHGAGVIGASRESGLSGFRAIERMVQVPLTFENAAAVAGVDGRIDRIEAAPQGGQYVWIGDKRHYAHPGVNLTVKVGDVVEAGDAMSEGVSNPLEVVRHKHIGEGRRYFQRQIRNTLENQRIRVNRRNLELLSRGLINHVRVVEPDAIDGALPDDIIPYDDLASKYQPRSGARQVRPEMAKGRFLERPVLHYSIGTRVTPSVISTLRKHGVKQVVSHDDPPAFEPYMVRGLETTIHDPDFFRRLSGFYPGKGFLDAARRGGTSQVHGRNWQHSLAEATQFGKSLSTSATY